MIACALGALLMLCLTVAGIVHLDSKPKRK
jgi:hypothetical protein